MSNRATVSRLAEIAEKKLSRDVSNVSLVTDKTRNRFEDNKKIYMPG
jgi:hypothetical protein